MSEVISHADYNQIFDADGAIDGLPLERLRLSQLRCLTGQIVTADPLACPDMPPLRPRVPPGTYPVDLYIVKTPLSGFRVAIASLSFSGKRATRWALALREGQSYEQLTQKGLYFGFPVDAGLAAFYDLEALAKYDEFSNQFDADHPEGNLWDDYFAALFLPNARDPQDPHDIGNWLDFTLPNAPEHNMALFQSGMGDGIYPSYWGIAADGTISRLVIDFHIALLPDTDGDSDITPTDEQSGGGRRR